jgi:predicted RNA-binding Zn-ribbon protein involved in translation (DUF1610 family)
LYDKSKIICRIYLVDSKLSLLYSFENIETLTSFDHALSRANKIVFKKCPNCGNYFIPESRTDEVYCSNISPQDKTKTCKEYGARLTYLNKLKKNVADGMCRSIYMSILMQVKRNPDNQDYSKFFTDFKTQSKKWKLDVKKNIRTEQEFLTWLLSKKSELSIK